MNCYTESMTARAMLVACVFATTAVAAAAATLEENKAFSKQRRIIYNNDGCSGMALKKNVYSPSVLTEEDLRMAVDEVAWPGSLVDTYILCINAQVMFYPTKVGTMLGDCALPEERAKWDDHARQWVQNIQSFNKAGIDPYAVILARAKEQGLETLISFRMNDAHGCSHLRCRFWNDHPNYRLGSGLDFGKAEVRDYTFRLIEEAAKRYKVDGIELDFNRFPTFFKKGSPQERIKMMNELVRRVREMLNQLGETRQKRLLLTARVPTSPGQCREQGLDPTAWAKAGWIDFLTVSEFICVRFDLPVAPWKQLIREVPIYGCIEAFKSDKTGPRNGCVSPAEYQKAARHLLKDGADGIYLFNFFCTRELGDKAFEPPFELLEKLHSGGF